MKGSIQYFVTAGLILSLAACSKKNVAQPNSNVATQAQGSAPVPAAPPAAVSEPTIPTGTRLHVALIDGLSTAENRAGDQFTATLSAPVIVDGNTILDKDTKVRGRVTDVEESGRIKGRASIRLVLTDIHYHGTDVAISTRPFVAVAQSTKKRDAEIIGGGTGVGALIGAIAGGSKGAAIGAAVGAGGGTGTVLATKGKELRYPPETKMSFMLVRDIQL